MAADRSPEKEERKALRRPYWGPSRDTKGTDDRPGLPHGLVRLNPANLYSLGSPLN